MLVTVFIILRQAWKRGSGWNGTGKEENYFGLVGESHEIEGGIEWVGRGVEELETGRKRVRKGRRIGEPSPGKWFVKDEDSRWLE